MQRHARSSSEKKKSPVIKRTLLSEKRKLPVWPGKPFPLGAHWNGEGVNFALFAQHAERVELCLFSSTAAKRETHRIDLPFRTEHVWHGFIPELKPGQIYGYRVCGKYDPLHGVRFNPNKLLLDPYTRAVARRLSWHDAVFGFNVHDRVQADLSFNPKDSAAHAPLSVVFSDDFDWGKDVHPRTPWESTVIYEAHVKGLTMTHPKVPPNLRGTFLGLACDAVIEHLTALGVTAIELLPVHQAIDDGHLLERGLCNYWGYNTLAFFAPDSRFCTVDEPAAAVNEFKQMVKALHAAGIEVILDVVFNHTCEGNERGPTLSLRGIDNQAYYRLPWQNPRYYMDYTGCGNSLNTQHPQVLQLISDCLRYWVEEMHVDGFRFDLASTLAREAHAFDGGSGFLDIVHQDPALRETKLIAEPWDTGEEGYRLGQFPVRWREWNDKYKRTLRSFWKGDSGLLGELATSLSGSSTLFEPQRRSPVSSINYITCHDGFTLTDLVSYNQKHIKTNGENNTDGEDNNLSWNCGHEGPTSRPKVRRLRLQQRKNLFASLLLSIGVPMICAGDEIGRSQRGNNNSYCLDDHTSWLDWHLDAEDREFLSFAQQLARFRREQPALRRRTFFSGMYDAQTAMKDISWFSASGQELTSQEWHNPELLTLGVLLAGNLCDATDDKGRRCAADSIFYVLNAAPKDVHFLFPYSVCGDGLELICDTSLPAPAQHKKVSPLRRGYDLRAHSLALFSKSAQL